MATTTIFDAYEKVMAEKRVVKAQQMELEFQCSNCKSKLASIFQEDGDFCVECWQIITHPNVQYY